MATGRCKSVSWPDRPSRNRPCRWADGPRSGQTRRAVPSLPRRPPKQPRPATAISADAARGPRSDRTGAPALVAPGGRVLPAGGFSGILFRTHLSHLAVIPMGSRTNNRGARSFEARSQGGRRPSDTILTRNRPERSFLRPGWASISPLGRQTHSPVCEFDLTSVLRKDGRTETGCGRECLGSSGFDELSFHSWNALVVGEICF